MYTYVICIHFASLSFVLSVYAYTDISDIIIQKIRRRSLITRINKSVYMCLHICKDANNKNTSVNTRMYTDIHKIMYLN